MAVLLLLVGSGSPHGREVRVQECDTWEELQARREARGERRQASPSAFHTGVIIMATGPLTAVDGTVDLPETIRQMTVRVGTVLCESPAAASGLRKGDRILSVNNRYPHEQGVLPTLQYPRRAEESFRVKVQRGEDTLTITVVSVRRPRTAGGTGEYRGLGVGMLILVVTGCRVEGAAVGEGPVVRDSAGVQVVENHGTGLWTSGEKWKLSDHPRVEIGSAGEDSGTAFHRVTGAVRLSDGRIVVANGGTSELLFFSSAGALQRRAGGAGGGPGEFMSLMGAGSIIPVARTPGDTIRASDQFGGKILVYSPAGDFVRAASLIDGPKGEPVHLASGVGWLDDGSLVAVTTSFGDDPATRPGPEARIVRPRVTLRRFDSNGTLTDTIGVFPGDESFTSLSGRLDASGSGTVSVGRAPVPFARTFHAAGGGNRIAAGITDRMEVRIYGPEGTLQRIVRGPDTPRRVDPSPREGVDRPAFADLLLDAEGRLWVESYRAPGEVPGPSRWGVYDTQGRHLGEVTMPERFQPLEIGADYVLGVWKDEMGVEYLHLHALGTGPPVP